MDILILLPQCYSPGFSIESILRQNLENLTRLGFQVKVNSN